MPASVFADQEKNTIIKEYKFQTDDTNFDYKAENEIRSDGATYKLKGISRYKVIDEKKRIEKTATYTDLKEKDLPAERSFNIDGRNVNLKLDLGSAVFNEITITKTFKYHNKNTKPELPNTKLISSRSGTHTGTLQNISTIKTREPFTITAQFIGPKGTVYEWKGKEIDFGSGTFPTWENCEAELLSYFGLPNGSEITDAIWTSGYIESGDQTVRYAKFTGTRPSFNYKATYTYTKYNAAATYSNGYEDAPSYTVVAYAEYQKNEKPAPVIKQEPQEKPDLIKIAVFVGTGVFLLSALIVLILYVLRRRKKVSLQDDQLE